MYCLACSTRHELSRGAEVFGLEIFQGPADENRTQRDGVGAVNSAAQNAQEDTRPSDRSPTEREWILSIRVILTMFTRADRDGRAPPLTEILP